MKKVILCALLAGSLGGLAFAQSKTAVKSAVDQALARLASAGAAVEYVSAELQADGSVLLSGVTIASEDGEATLSAEYIEGVPGEEEGYVTLNFPPEMLVTLVPDNDETLTYQMAIRSEGFSYTGNLGDAEAAQMDGSIEAQTLQVQGLTANHPVLNLLDITNTGVSFEVSGDEAAEMFSLSGTIDLLSGEYSYEMGEANQSASADFSVDGMSMAFESAGNFDTLAEDFDAFLEAGGGFDLVMAFGPSVGSSVNRSPEFSVEVNGRSGRTDAVVALSKNGMAYQTRYDGFDYQIEPLDGSLPVPPFSVSMARGLIDLALPLSQTEEAEEARIGIDLIDVTADEGLWSLIDPEKVLPRTPATVELGLRADMRLNAPFTQSMQRMAGNPMSAGQFERVSLDKLILSIAGASVTAEGAVDVDNSGFLPQPNGEVDVVVKGVTGLSQNLVALGLLDQMQAGMAMGMMMAFAKPGTEPDEFTSKIEFKDGGIYANGQQIQ